MHDTNIVNHNHVFEVLKSQPYNTYGVLLESVNESKNIIYSGNFWWMTGKYAKTIDITNIVKNRWNAELQYIQKGNDWKPFSYFIKDTDGVSLKNNNTKFNFNKLI
jgi:hypothetical protein